VPGVSVGLPVRNGEAFLAQTLESLLTQDHDDLEIVISDNASTDATEDICRDAGRGDSRVQFHRSDENRGAAWNYNRVLELARFPFFKWAAADDVCRPTFLTRCLEQLVEEGEGVVISYPETTLVDIDGADMGPIDDSDLAVADDDPARRLDQLLRNRFEWHPVFGVMRTDVLRTTRGIGVFPMADVVLLAEMALRGRFRQVPERLFLRRYHEQRSIAAGPSFVEQVAWYDPARRARFALPQARVSTELMKAVARAPIGPAASSRAALAVLRRWTVPHWRHIGGEVKIAARAWRAPAGRG
jgi:glycosyltransferase involved in cell wall biosynthesis